MGGPDGEPGDATRFGLWHQDLELEHDLIAGRDGAFELRLPAGRLTLQIEAPDHPPLALGERVLDAGARLDLGTLVLDRSAFVVGNFGAGRGIDLGTLRMDWYLASTQVPVRGALLAGGFRSPPLPPGTHTAVVQGDGVERLEFQMSVEAGVEQRRDVRLTSAPTRRVVLVLAPGAPRPTFVRARLTHPDGKTCWDWAHTATPAGPLELSPSAAAGLYILEVETDGGLSAEGEIVLGDESAATLFLALR